MFRLFVQVLAGVIVAAPAFAAQYKGKSLNSEKFKADLVIDGAAAVEGQVRFKVGKKLVFKARNGTEVDLRIRNICADGHEDRVDVCWPNLKVDIDDLTSRTGVVRIKGGG